MKFSRMRARRIVASILLYQLKPFIALAFVILCGLLAITSSGSAVVYLAILAAAALVAEPISDGLVAILLPSPYSKAIVLAILAALDGEFDMLDLSTRDSVGNTRKDIVDLADMQSNAYFRIIGKKEKWDAIWERYASNDVHVR